jgi:uncharacterized protein (TIGR00725 family)
MAAAPFIAVIGAGDAPAEVRALAFEVGREIAAHGAVLVCGGLGGVMEAAAQGAREAGGHTIGILPGYNRQFANRYIEFAIATGMGEARNAIVIGSAGAAVALAGEGGTLAEIGFALKLKRPVVALGAWNEIAGLYRADTPAAAVTLALKLAGKPTEAPTR